MRFAMASTVQPFARKCFAYGSRKSRNISTTFATINSRGTLRTRLEYLKAQRLTSAALGGGRIVFVGSGARWIQVIQDGAKQNSAILVQRGDCRHR